MPIFRIIKQPQKNKIQIGVNAQVILAIDKIVDVRFKFKTLNIIDTAYFM